MDKKTDKRIKKMEQKTKGQFIKKIKILQQRITEFEKTESKHKKAEEKGKSALSYANSIIATAREPILVLSKKLRVISANRSFYTNFKVTEKETVGRYLPDLGNRQWNIPDLLHLLKEILPKETIVVDCEVEHDFETIGHRIMRLNACQLRVSKEVVRAITEEEEEEELILLAIEDITERKETEELKRLLHDVGERVKELNCLYSLSKLVEKPDLSLEKIFQGTVDLLPPAWQYPEITCARIVFENNEFKTDRFKITKWRHSADINVYRKKAGFVEACYLQKKSKSYEGPFSKEEKDLINAIAERLGKIAERKKGEEDLKAQTWRLEKANKGIKVLYKKLEKAHKGLMKIDEMKSDFVSHVSHELRTPLTTIREANAQLLDGLRGPLNEGQRKFLEISQRNLDRLNRIINNLLDLGRLEAGKITLERKSVDITTLAREAIENLKPQAVQQRIKLEDKMPPSLPEIFVDPDRIRQVFINLMGNALKYSKEGGKITLTAKQKRGILEASVADTGIGVPPEHLDRIFERFERVAKVPIPGVGGAGLGLPICKDLLEMHKGKIWVESKVDKGSKFTFSLPMYKEANFLKDYLGEQIQEAKRHHSFVSLIMVNMENFRQLNKEYGTKVLEELQNQLEDLIGKYIRDPMDKVFKYKEDTLALVLIGTPKANGQAVLKRLERQALKHKFKAKNTRIKLPLRFKEVTYPVDGQTEGGLIENAKDIISR